MRDRVCRPRRRQGASARAGGRGTGSIRRVLALLLSLMFLSGCGTAEGAVPSDAAPAERQRLVVYTSHKQELYDPIIQEFERRTGIWVEVHSGGTNELLNRLREEQDHPKADVMFGGGAESLESAQECFTPYVSPQIEYMHRDLQPSDGLWTPFSALPVVLIYNTNLVSEEERPESWSDLLAPRFQGRIALADPSLSGTGFTALATYLYATGGDRVKNMERLAAALEGRQLEASLDALESVIQGDCLVGVVLEDSALQHIAAGDNLGMVYPSEGTSCIPDGSALVKGAPHEDNAKRFINFTASRDVQRLLPERFFRRAMRTDIPWRGELAQISQVLLLDYDVRHAAHAQKDVLDEWAACMEKEGGA